MQKAFKYRIYPTEQQEQFLAVQFGNVRYTYNHFLDRRQTEWEINNKTLNYYDCTEELVELKNELPWLREANSQSLQFVLKNLDTAYVNFFKKRSRFPKAKRKN